MVQAFSHFSAASELFVTAGVFYFFARAMRFNDFRWAFMWTLIAFETLVNITYMASRFVQAQPESGDHPGWATLLLISHGTLSLVMFLGLIAFVLIAFRQRHVEKRNFFTTHANLTWVFLAFWSVSVLSGEALYVFQLTGTLEL